MGAKARAPPPGTRSFALLRRNKVRLLAGSVSTSGGSWCVCSVRLTPFAPISVHRLPGYIYINSYVYICIYPGHYIYKHTHAQAPAFAVGKPPSPPPELRASAFIKPRDALGGLCEDFDLQKRPQRATWSPRNIWQILPPHQSYIWLGFLAPPPAPPQTPHLSARPGRGRSVDCAAPSPCA